MSDSFQEILSRAVRAGLAPGLIGGWISADSKMIHTRSAGVRQLKPESKNPGIDTWYDLASLTKPLVVTTLFLLARREGSVDLKSTVGQYFQEAGFYRSVTLEHLLTHSSGLPGWAPLYATRYSPEDIVSSIGELIPIGLAGEVIQYSCPGFILLGKVLEKALGTDLAHAFTKLVSDPLRLSGDLGFNPDPNSVSLAGGAARPEAEIQLIRARGIEADVIPQWKLGLADDGNARFLGGIAGNSGLFGTIKGVLLLAREFQMDGGDLLNSDESDLVSQPFAGIGGHYRGLGWQIAASDGCSAGSTISADSIGHVGFTGTSVWIDRQRDCLAALLSNRHHPGHRETDLHPLRRRFNSLVLGPRHSIPNHARSKS